MFHSEGISQLVLSYREGALLLMVFTTTGYFKMDDHGPLLTAHHGEQSHHSYIMPLHIINKGGASKHCNN